MAKKLDVLKVLNGKLKFKKTEIMKFDKASRFCQLVKLINDKNEMLDKERDSFYDGGKSFNDIFESDLDELNCMENELLDIIQDTNRY